MSEDNKNYLDEESEEESTEKVVPNIDIYKYTNKGKVHEFNLGLLTPKERKKFDKMSNKERQRFIASVELQQMPSMFDEISLKSVVYPDPESNIGDVQAAAAKYNELVKLEEDPKFNQMVQGYLKFDEAQKYILKYCPHITRNDIDLLLKLKPDITVYQFINYYKNIMNDKNLVELNNIQKQLKNPYSDDVLKKVLNSGELLSKKILQLIVDKDLSKLEEIKTILYYVANVKHPEPGRYYTINDEISKIIGIPAEVKYSNYSLQQRNKFNTLYSVINNLITDVKERCKKLAESLTDMGMKTSEDEVYNDIMCKKDVYQALESYIQEKIWKRATKDVPDIKTSKEKDEKLEKKEEKDDEDKERKEKEEEMRKQYELTMPREDQSVNVDPMNEDGEAFESIDSSTYPVLSKDVIDDINTSQPSTNGIPEIIPFETKKDDVSQMKTELNMLIRNRIAELEKEYADKMEDYSRIYGEIPTDKKGLGIIKRDNRETTTYNHSSAEYTRIYNLLKEGIRMRLFKDTNTNKRNKHYESLGENFGTDEMVELAKKIDKLGGSIFSRIKNTFKAPDEIKETKMKLSELSERTIQNNKSLRELEKTIAELTERVNELSKQVGKSYVERQMNKPSFLDEIAKPHPLKPVEKPISQPIPQENPDSMEAQMRRKLEERRKDLEPDYSEESEEEWGEGVGGKIKIQSSDVKKPIPMSDFFKKYL